MLFRSHSETSSTAATPEPRPKVSLKGKEREDSAGSEDRAGATGASKKKKGDLPIESILEGGTAAWQAE